MLVLAVREGSRLGTQSGWACQFCAYTIGLKEIGLVRADRVLGRESSKRVQCGEPLVLVSDHRYLTDSITLT